MKYNKNWLFFVISVLFKLNLAVAGHPASLEEAKNHAQKIWADHRVTFYSQCPFDDKLNIDHQHCAYQYTSNIKHKVTWHHVVPIMRFQMQKPCWREYLCKDSKDKKFKGEKCCQEIDKNFPKMITDLHNLVPEIHELNAEIKNFHIGGLKHDAEFGEFYAESRPEKFNFRGCKIHVSKDYQVIEPADEMKGFVARAHLYMKNVYSLNLSEYQKKMFEKWNLQYPPTAWEITWNNKVNDIQGSNNYFISKHPLVMAAEREKRTS